MNGINGSSATPGHYKLAGSLPRLPEIAAFGTSGVSDEPSMTKSTEDYSDAENSKLEVQKASFASLQEILSKPAPELDFLLPELVPAGKNVFFRVSPGVDAQQFALAVGFAVAAGSSLNPFGKANVDARRKVPSFMR